MENTFTPRSLSIKQIFTDSDSLYQIPRYQRPYRWIDDQLEKLWDDLYDSYQENIQNYFLGSIILAYDSKKSSYRDVVDGQQRLTTLTILLCTLRDLFPNINNTEDINPENIDANIINNSIFYNGKHNRLKLYTHSQHQNDFNSLIINKNINDLKKPYKYQIYKDEDPKFKFINTALFFKERLIDIGEKETSKFINYLFNNVYIIRIECKTTEFAIRMFQVLNDRGMDLTNGDLIKSFLFEKLLKNSQDEEVIKKNENSFMSTWQYIENLINDIDINLNDMLVIYEYYLLANNPKKSLYDELEKVFKDRDPLEIINDFKNFAENYKKQIFDGENKTLFSLWYIRWSMYWKSIVCTAIHENHPNVDEIVFLLRRFYYLNWIAGKTLTKIKQISFNIIKWIKEKKSISFIENKLNQKLEDDGIIQIVKESLVSSNIYNSPWIKPLLIMIEYNQIDSTRTFINLDNNLHTEHILPIGWKKFQEWKRLFTNEIAEEYLNSIGNLTLLSGKKNIEASNNPFNKKIDVYTGKGKYKNKNDKITSFSITQKIVNDYNSNTFNKEWNINAIHSRWNWFLNEITELLQIDLKDLKK